MSKQTFIDWQTSSLVIAGCSGRGPGTKLDKISCQRISLDDESASNTASQALAKAVDELGLAKTEATILAPRELVEVRTVNVPKIDPDELPDVIRYQAQRQLANMSDNWTLDFVMLPQDPGQEMQTALVAAISPTNMAELANACVAANLQLAHVLLSPMEIARFALATGTLSAGASMVVCLSAENVDLLILKAGHVVLIRGTKLPTDPQKIPAAVSGEVRRSLMAASNQLSTTQIENVLIIAAPALARLIEQPVGEAVGASVSVVDPTSLLPASLADREQLASDSANRIVAIAGAASLAASDKSTVIDFADPKRRPPPKKNTVRYLLAAAAVVALILAGGSWWYSTNKYLDEELAFYEGEVESKQLLKESAQKKVVQLNVIQAFLDRSPNFLDEFTYIARKIPSSEKVLLGGPTCTIQADGRAQISVPVAADDDTSISEFERSLSEGNQDYEVIRRNPRRIDGATGHYAWETVETIRIRNHGWEPVDGSLPSKVEPSGEAASDNDEPAGNKPADTSSPAGQVTPESLNKAGDDVPVPDKGRQAGATSTDDPPA